jgi:hypothetical protein
MYIAGIILTGVFFGTLYTQSSVTIQRDCPKEYLGRVFSLDLSLAGFFLFIGTFISSTITNVIKLKTKYICLFGIAFFMIYCLFYLCFFILNLDRRKFLDEINIDENSENKNKEFESLEEFTNNEIDKEIQN